MSEESTTEPVASEPVVEAAPVSEPISEPALEPQISEPTPTAQPVEPLEYEPGAEAEPTSEPVSAPAPTSVVVPVSRARELLAKAREMIQFRKKKKLERIMGMFLKQAGVTNDEVEKLLHVSDATATRYLSQLEKEGKIKQEGKTGKGVSYSRM